MTKITIQLDDEKAERLRVAAEKHGVTTDQFLAASINDLLARTDSEFESAVQDVLQKNRNLYERLA